MCALHRDWPADPDISFLLADAWMVQKPWKLWDLKTGKPVAEVQPIMEVLGAALELAPGGCTADFSCPPPSPPHAAILVGNRIWDCRHTVMSQPAPPALQSCLATFIALTAR